MSLAEQIRDTLGSSFTVERELGGGGMSRVFVAYDQALERRVVVKVLSPELMADVNAERFRREVLVVAGLQHPHIVPVLSAGEMAGRPYLVMPYVEGESLRARITRSGPIRIVDGVGVLRDVARALAYAHERGIVHRDIKPDNVLIHAGSAVVADFGVAKALDVARRTPGTGSQGTLTAAGSSMGTPGYMAPEQIAADPNADYRVDIYAFGVTAYEALAAKHPFHGRPPHALLAAHLSEVPPSLATLRPDVPAALVSLVMRCLEKDPDKRPQNAQQILTALDDPAVLSGELTPTTGAAIAAQARASRRQRAVLVVAAVFAVVAAVQRRAGVTSNLDTFAGLIRREPWLAILMTLFMLSLTGIPPTAGFFAKAYVILPAVQASQEGWTSLGVVAVITGLNAAVAAFYYLRVLLYMFVREPQTEQPALTHGRLLWGGLAVSAVLTVVLGLVPGFLDVVNVAARAIGG